MSFIDDFETIEITLPDYLAKFLKEISEEFAMSPSQFITHVLQPYYEVYRKGLQKRNDKE